MTMPGASTSSHDSVENDFASPVKKLKVEEEDITSVPMSQDSVDAGIDLTPRDFFKIWCTVYGKVYPNKKEEEFRFDVFQQSLDRAIPSGLVLPANFPGFADRTKEELEVLRDFNRGDCYSSISREELKACKNFRRFRRRLPPDFPKVDAATDLTPRKAFKIWCYFYEKLYDEEEEEWRFELFKQSLDKALPPGCVSNFPALAASTEEEINEFREYMKRDIYSSVSLEELKARALHLILNSTNGNP